MTHQADGGGADPTSSRLPSGVAQLLSALFYGTCSFLIVLVNKALLTTYGSGGRRGSGRDPRAGGGRGGGGGAQLFSGDLVQHLYGTSATPRAPPAGWLGLSGFSRSLLGGTGLGEVGSAAGMSCPQCTKAGSAGGWDRVPKCVAVCSAP